MRSHPLWSHAVALVSMAVAVVACGRTNPRSSRTGATEAAAAPVTLFEKFACGSQSKFPRAQVQALDPLIMNDAWLVLGNETKDACLIRAVLILGTLGGEREAAWLESLLTEETVGPISQRTNSGLGTVPLALAYVATRHREAPFAMSIAEKLRKCASPGYWSGRLPWVYRAAGVAERTLTTDCVDALGSLEFPGTADLLLEIAGDATRSADDRVTAESAYDRFQRIQGMGGLVRAWQEHP